MKPGENATHALTGQHYRIVRVFGPKTQVAFLGTKKVLLSDNSVHEQSVVVKAWLDTALLDPSVARGPLALGEVNG